MNPLNIFVGNDLPSWVPETNLQIGDRYTVLKQLLKPATLPREFTEFFYIADHFLKKECCKDIIDEFDRQSMHPVGVSGYGDLKESAIGSYRANAWAVSFAEKLSNGLKDILVNEAILEAEPFTAEPVFLNTLQQRLRMPVQPQTYTLLGSTPFMRFMKYQSGGCHVPHYDAPFANIKAKYITLMSWVLYLNTPVGSGGEFQFVDDRQWEVSPLLKNKNDWQRMAIEQEILESVAPREGRLLIFPHWLAHQVSLYLGSETSSRYIIRGDVAYGHS